MLPAGQICHVGGGVVKKLGGIVVDLIEGIGRQPQPLPAEDILQVVLTPKCVKALTENYVGVLAIAVDQYARKAREFSDKIADQILSGLLWQAIGVDHQRQKHGAVCRRAYVNVAEGAFACGFIVCRDARAIQRGAYRPYQLAKCVGLQRAIRAGNHLVGLGGVKAGFKSFLSLPNGVHTLVSVTCCHAGGQHGTYRDIRKTGLPKGHFYAGLLGAQLVLITQMTINTPAAGLRRTAEFLLGSHGGGGRNAQKPSDCVGGRALDDLCLYHVSRDSALDEQHKACLGSLARHTAYTATQVVKIVNG